jgi:hypothetical protein
MLRVVAGCASLMLLFALPGASAGQTKAAGAVVLEASHAEGCPVGFSARHANQGATVKVSPQEKSRRQGYELNFVPDGQHGIAEARVTLHGLSGARVIPAGETAPAGSEASETFHLSPASGGNHLFRSTVYTEKLTGVLWVELNELTYADGTTWHESERGSCRITPNGFLLVNGGR